MLAFGIIIEPETIWAENAGKVKFKIDLNTGDENDEFFSKIIDISKTNKNEMFWEEIILPVEKRYADKSAKIIFKIEGDVKDPNNEIWCGWIEPVLLNKYKNIDALKRRVIFTNVKEKESLQKKCSELENKLNMLSQILKDKEKENKDIKLEVENKVKRIGELNKKIMHLESQIDQMQEKIDELLALKDEYESSLSGKMKKMLKGKGK